jgi:hypothetical protein
MQLLPLARLASGTTINTHSSGYEPSNAYFAYKVSVSTARQCKSCLVVAVSCMGPSKGSSSSTAGDSGGEDLESFAPSTPTPPNRGGLLRTPSNTTLAFDFPTVTKRKGKGKFAVAPVPSEPRRMDNGAERRLATSNPVDLHIPSNNRTTEKKKKEKRI